MIKLIKCSRICVDCVENDPVDIRCGGPDFLGFDFNVRVGKEREMEKFIIATLNEFNVPLERIYVDKIIGVPEKDVWDKKRIATCIQNDADYLRSQKEDSKYYLRRYKY